MNASSQWVTVLEFARIMGKSPQYVRRCASIGYFHDFGISVCEITHGTRRLWFLSLPSSLL